MNPSLPIQLLYRPGVQLFDWLGTFWQGICQDSELIRQYQQGRGTLYSQLALNYLETQRLIDRQNMPVGHRERWHAFTINKAGRNTGPAAAVKLDRDDENPPVIGPQLTVPYVPGRIFELGKYTELLDTTTYPLASQDPILATASVLTDDPSQPTVALIQGLDFYVEDGTIFFLRHNDPFTSGRFPVAGEGDDQQVILWMADVVFDRQYPSNFGGYVLGLEDLSDAFFVRYLNAIWDVYSGGPSLGRVQAALAAMCDEPVILETTETVVCIASGYSGRAVVTDKHAYPLTDAAVLRSVVVPGAVLTQGELLTASVRVYDNLDPKRLAAGTDPEQDLRVDMPALHIPARFFQLPIRHGFGVTWELTDIVRAGTDINGHGKLRFQVYGQADEIELFWQGFWTHCEGRNIDPAVYFQAQLSTSIPTGDGRVVGKISPLEYFLSNFFKTNMLVCVVDLSRLSVRGRQTINRVTALRNALPAHTFLLLLEHIELGPEELDLGDETEEELETMPARILADTAGTAGSLEYVAHRPLYRHIPTCR